MATFNTTLYNNYKDAYNDIVNQITHSSVLSPAQIADCLEALATITSPNPTGSVSNTPVTPPGTGRYEPVIPNTNTHLA